jgi:hypothetical protein
MQRIAAIALVAQPGRGNLGYCARGEQEGLAEPAGQASTRAVEG